MSDYEIPDPVGITTLKELTRALTMLRRRAAGKGQVQMPVREIAKRTGRAPSTLDPYLRGQRLCPESTYEDILVVLGVPRDRLRPWLDAWERVADGAERPNASPARHLNHQIEFLYRLRPPPTVDGPRLGIITGDLRRVKSIEIWVNSENTQMRMARFDDCCISAVIRFESARHDGGGGIVHDPIADELEHRVHGRRPVHPGTAIMTGPGQLAGANGVEHVIHVAAVQGEPGRGYRQVRDVGRCVTNACALAETLCARDGRPRAVLFPLLGTGSGGGDLRDTVEVLLGAAVDHLSTRRSLLRTVYFLAYTAEELAICREAFDGNPRLDFHGADTSR
ncbi:macro domain-containing protein [Acrocarpospora catenulata]|uniref:macro domain-containing protein n=1 Tax=Acrocarpospora catenulata TaxID=2836182 RepID=UPI001BD956DC|nr:helix-turn-helix domain-containing protein [Acrocarpospora catenulata]